jgi:hypothetical protein
LEDKDDSTSKKKKARVKEFLELTATHQTLPPSSCKQLFLPMQNNSPDKIRFTKKLSLSPLKKSLEDDSILNIPLI